MKNYGNKQMSIKNEIFPHTLTIPHHTIFSVIVVLVCCETVKERQISDLARFVRSIPILLKFVTLLLMLVVLLKSEREKNVQEITLK